MTLIPRCLCWEAGCHGGTGSEDKDEAHARHEHSVSILTAAAKSTEKNTALIFSLPFFPFICFEETSEKIADYLLSNVLGFWLLVGATGSLFSTG